MLKIVAKNITNNAIKELLEVSYIEAFRTSIFIVNYKGKEFYSFPFKDENNDIISHILINKNFRKVIHLDNNNNSYWIKKSKVFVPEYLLISDRPELLIQYVSKKKHILNKTNYVCFSSNLFNKQTFEYIHRNIKFRKVITVFSESSMKDIFKLKTAFLLNNSNIDFTKLESSYLITSNGKTITTKKISYPYIRNRFKLKFKDPMTHK